MKKVIINLLVFITITSVLFATNGVDALSGQLQSLEGQLSALQKLLEQKSLEVSPKKEDTGKLLRKFKLIYDGTLKQVNLKKPIDIQTGLARIIKKTGEENILRLIRGYISALNKFQTEDKYKKEKKYNALLIKYRAVLEKMLVLVLSDIMNEFDAAKNYKGNGLITKPFSQEQADLFTFALRNYEKINSAAANAIATANWPLTVQQAVGKNPVKSNMPSPKEQAQIINLTAEIKQAQAKKAAKALTQNEIPGILKKIVDLRTILEGLGKEINTQTAKFYAELCTQVQCTPAFSTGNLSSEHTQRNVSKQYRIA